MSNNFLVVAFAAAAFALVCNGSPIASRSKNPDNKYWRDSAVRPAGANMAPEKGSPLDMATEQLQDKMDLSQADKDLQGKLVKMKELISGIHSGVDKASNIRALSMKLKFNKLSTIITELSKEKNRIYETNVKLRGELRNSVQRLQHLETALKIEAKRANDNDVKLWFDTKSDEIKTFLNSAGVQNYLDPKFNPIMASVAMYGLILLPLLLASAYLTSNLMNMTLLHTLYSINVFEVSYMTFSIGSMVLLLTGDPWVRSKSLSVAKITSPF